MEKLEPISPPRQIARASIILIIASSLGYFISLLKEILIAARFGIGQEMDAFYASTTIPYIASGIIGSFIIGVFIPVFMESKTNKTEAQLVLNLTATYIYVFLAALMLLTFSLAHFIVAITFPGLNPETAQLTINLLRLTCVLIFLSNHIYLATAVLNTEKHFTIPAFSNILVTITIIACVFFLYKSLAIWALAIGLVAGTFIQMITVGLALKKQGYFYKPQFNWSHPALIKMRQLGLIYLLAVLAGHFTIVVDRFMASALPTGSIAAYGYASRLVDTLTQVFCFSVATAAFPYFVSDVVEGKTEQLRNSFSSGIRMLGFILIPMTVFLVLMAKPIIQLLFQRGAFDETATHITSITFACYAGQLFFFGVWILATRAFLALKNIKILFYLSLITVIIKILFNLCLMQLIKPPIAGIALSTTTMYLVIMAIAFILLRNRLGSLNGKYILSGIGKIWLSAFVMSLILLMLLRFMHSESTSVLLFKQIINLIIFGGISLVVFLGVAHLLRIEEIQKIRTLLFNK
ncbi:MAG: murein biosynthesis integral membrane protein MurJ [Planctomycetota bacterium]